MAGSGFESTSRNWPSPNNHKTFKNLIVTGYYKPHPDQLDANLERDGIIELGGNRLGTRRSDSCWPASSKKSSPATAS